jgi:hypothetical protein
VIALAHRAAQSRDDGTSSQHSMSQHSIVVACLKEINAFDADAVHQSMFLRNPPRPTASQQISQRLGFSWALEGIAQHRFDQIQYSDRGTPVALDPIP